MLTCYLKILTCLAKNALSQECIVTTQPFLSSVISILVYPKEYGSVLERDIIHVDYQHFTVWVVEYMSDLTEIGVLRFLFLFMFSYSLFLKQSGQ